MPMKPTQTKSTAAKPASAKPARAARATGEGKLPKPARGKQAGAKPVPVAETPTLAMVEDQTPVVQADAGEGKAARGQGVASVKMKDLIDQVTEALGGKRQDVKPVVEATLARLGAVLGRGENLNLQGFGNFRVVRPASAENPVIRLKLRLTEGKKPQAPSGEED